MDQFICGHRSINSWQLKRMLKRYSIKLKIGHEFYLKIFKIAPFNKCQKLIFCVSAWQNVNKLIYSYVEVLSFLGVIALVFLVQSQPIEFKFLIWRSLMMQAAGANNTKQQIPVRTKFIILNPCCWLNWNIGWLRNL